MTTKPTAKKTRTAASNKRTPPQAKIALNREAAQERRVDPSQLKDQFKELRLPSFRDHFEEQAIRAATEQWIPMQYLANLTELELQVRKEGRVRRLLNRSQLPLGKTWESFDFKRLPLGVHRIAETLRTGIFLDRRENVLIFGRPGSGKTHLLCGLAEQLIHQGRSVLFTTCSLLVQQLLLAKRDLRLPKYIRQLSSYEALVIDDLGYVQQSREEMEVLFTLLAERYERGSVMLTSNLPFSKWEQIFKDAMTTAAAIDRLVHPSVIVELNVASYRAETAKQNQKSTTLPMEE